MRRLLILLLTCFISVNIFAAASVQTIVNQLAPAFIQNQDIPGVAIAISYQGKDYFYFYGAQDANDSIPVNKNTIFDLASISKVYATTLLATEVQAGKIKLNDPIVKYIPELAKTKGLPIDKVTVQELATHTASFPRDVQGFGVALNDRAGLMLALKEWEPSYPIGSAYLYSNVSFGLLGVVIEGATGKPFMAELNQKVLQPLNMKNTFANIPPAKLNLRAQGFKPNGAMSAWYLPTFMIGGGGVRSSAYDMLQFMKANMNLPTANASTSLLAAMQFAQQPRFNVNPHMILGLGWQRITRDNALFITKNGGNIGFSSFVGFSPDKKFGVVVLGNKARSHTNALGWKILQALNNNS